MRLRSPRLQVMTLTLIAFAACSTFSTFAAEHPDAPRTAAVERAHVVHATTSAAPEARVSAEAHAAHEQEATNRASALVQTEAETRATFRGTATSRRCDYGVNCLAAFNACERRDSLRSMRVSGRLGSRGRMTAYNRSAYYGPALDMRRDRSDL